MDSRVRARARTHTHTHTHTTHTHTHTHTPKIVTHVMSVITVIQTENALSLVSGAIRQGDSYVITNSRDRKRFAPGQCSHLTGWQLQQQQQKKTIEIESALSVVSGVIRQDDTYVITNSRGRRRFVAPFKMPRTWKLTTEIESALSLVSGAIGQDGKYVKAGNRDRKRFVPGQWRHSTGRQVRNN